LSVWNFPASRVNVGLSGAAANTVIDLADEWPVDEDGVAEGNF
jgi:hypothetical protein